MKMQSFSHSWYNVNDKLPERYEYVLVETPYCKYPAVVAFHNGMEWISAHDKCKIENVRYWQHISLPEEKSV